MTEIVQCVGCGVERARNGLPEFCPICADERQYLPADGVQLWTTPAASAAGATLAVDAVEPGVRGIVLHNGCGIGQRPLLVATAVGNVMIEVPAHIDADAVDRVRALGGVAGIIASHPHMYGVQSLWSEAFGDAPVYVSRADAHWLGAITSPATTSTACTATSPGRCRTTPGMPCCA